MIAREPVISANGQFAAFIWTTFDNASFLSDGQNALIWRDLNNGITLPIAGPVQGAGAITADGRVVAYSTGTQVYLSDMVAGTNQLISMNDSGLGGFGNGSSINPLFSPDGRWVVFQSQANNLTTNGYPIPQALNGWYNLFARDLASNTTTLISADANGLAFSGSSTGAVFSSNGRYFAFDGSYTENSASVQKVYLFDFLARANTLVCTNCFNPSLSADGGLVAFERKRSGTSIDDLFVEDLRTGATELISLNRLGTGGGNGTSTSPLISADGRFVVFTSKASDLVENDNNNASDIFVRDRLQGKTLLVSLNKDGTGSGNGSSTKPVMAADGRTVIFQSVASDLVPGDYNDKRDVFVLRLAEGELRALTVTSVGSGTTTVLWSAVPGKSYQVQFKNETGDPNWTTLPNIVTASGTTAAAVDNSGGFPSHRFYRVMLAP